MLYSKFLLFISFIYSNEYIDGETVETESDFILGGSKIIADGDCSHEIKRCLLRSEERRVGKEWKQSQTLFWGAPKSLQMVNAVTKL